MTGQRIGCVRVSTVEQNADRPLDAVAVDRSFTERASGRDTNRPELQALLKFARDGDTVLVHSMDRLARNLDDLRAIVQDLNSREVRIEFVKEQLTFSGEDSPMATLLLSVMGALAGFERELIRERQREGVALAKERGSYNGRGRSLTEEQRAELRRRADSGGSRMHFGMEYGISRETVNISSRPSRRLPAAYSR
jgi:DNA invertase Pin-like site-specific DNA recombinase